MTRDTFIKLALAFGLAIAGIEVWWIVNATLPYDAYGFLIGRDFVNTWAGAKIALTGDPGHYFEYDAYVALLRSLFGENFPSHIWSYPPHWLLFVWPLAFLPYMTAYVLYSVAGFVLYLAVAADGERRRDHIALLALAPAVMLNIWTGQNGFLSTALLIGGLLQLDRRPILSGVLFGILTIKPQLGLLLPVMLVLTGRWRVIAAATVTAVLLAALTTAAFGTKVWGDYVHLALPVHNRMTADASGFFAVNIPTVFMSLRLAGVPAWLCYGVHGAVAAVIFAAAVWVFWRLRDPVLSLCFLVCATFAVTPYAFNYDMVAFGWVTLALLRRTDTEPADYALLLALWITPFAVIPMGLAGLPGSFLPILGLTARLFWRLRSEQAVAVPLPVNPLPAGAR